MNYEECIDKMINVQKALLEFFEENSSAEENFEILITIIKEQQIMEDQHELKELLLLVSSISNNHCRINNFNNKIEQIILYLKDKITKYFSNSEIFQLFEFNKRILLFLILEGIMKIDKYVFSRLQNIKYHDMNNPDYFLQEIHEFLVEYLFEGFVKAEIIENIKKEKKNGSHEIDEKRKLGENDDYLCKLIRLNEVKEFGAYVNKNNISLQSYINESKFETNLFLMKQKKVSLIEYAAFFGSIEIIKYMKINGDVELTPSMWLYAIHSQNAELIKYLEDNHISPPKNDYLPILKESIKCFKFMMFQITL
ncbi:hypothetical protein M9Y10_007004 [Tritrichomonas musculus]|uniref:DUF3447 domain-containing protein n=1 Tax=Tritrichomonas musculus TaxID=1915356 RepID=A0ABR2J155_9EUKA